MPRGFGKRKGEGCLHSRQPLVTGSVITVPVEAAVPIDSAMAAAYLHRAGRWQRRASEVVPFQTARGIARAMRVPNPAGTRKLDASCGSVGRSMVVRFWATRRLMAAIPEPLITRDDVALVLTLSLHDGCGQKGEESDPCRSGGGFSTVPGRSGGSGKARHGKGRAEEERD